MNMAVSVIKADVGSIGGHVAPSKNLIQAVRDIVNDRTAGLLIDSRVSHTGDDIAILMTHQRGIGDEAIHRLAWDAFVAATAEAKKTRLVWRRARSSERCLLGQRTWFGPCRG